MRTIPYRGATWLALYSAAALLPLLIAYVDAPRGRREFAIEFGVALGFVTFAVIGLQFLLTARFPRLAAPFGLDALLHFHRLTGILALTGLLAHVLLLVTARERFSRFLSVYEDAPRAVMLWAVLIGLALIVLLTLLRKRLQIPYQWWRMAHGLLAIGVLALAAVHIYQSGHYAQDDWKMAAYAGLAAVGIALLGWVRVVRPIQHLRRPYNVVDVRTVAPRVWSVALEPRGHQGMRFRGGQFAWLALNQKPWAADIHPFSFASSSTDQRIEFIIKELGDFTEGLGALRPGATAYLDGPYGNFHLLPQDAGVVFVAGGVGISPALSMLRSMRDLGDERPFWLVYGAGRLETVIAREELERFAAAENVHLSLVLEEPPEGWQGERGQVTRDVLARVLPPPGTPGIRYFVCGPGPMMDGVEAALVSLGVSTSAIRSERFDIA